MSITPAVTKLFNAPFDLENYQKSGKLLMLDLFPNNK